jgi:hypothetical protein
LPTCVSRPWKQPKKAEVSPLIFNRAQLITADIANLLFALILIFCGVLATPTSLPGFWKFMYYVSPFTYLASAMLSTGVANAKATCSDYELLHFSPPSGQTCGAYMDNFVKMAGGYVANPNATTDCAFCTISDTNVFLNAVSAKYEDRWRNFGILWVYVIFNIAAALFFYWLGRVPRKSKGPSEVARVAGEDKAEDEAEPSEKDGTPEAEPVKEGKDVAEGQEEGEKR